MTTVLLVAPVTLEIARYLEAPPYPFLFAEVFASNIGGTATLIGDPPNIIIGSAANLSFNDFVVNLTPMHRRRHGRAAGGDAPDLGQPGCGRARRREPGSCRSTRAS